MIRLSEMQPYKEMQIATAVTAQGTGIAVPYSAPTNDIQCCILEAVGDTITFKFGPDNTVAASKTVTSSLLPDGNYSLRAGQMLIVDLHGVGQAFVSTIGASGGGTAIIKLCKKTI